MGGGGGGGQFSRGNFLGGNSPGGNFLGGNSPVGNSPRSVSGYVEEIGDITKSASSTNTYFNIKIRVQPETSVCPCY